MLRVIPLTRPAAPSLGIAARRVGRARVAPLLTQAPSTPRAFHLSARHGHRSRAHRERIRALSTEAAAQSRRQDRSAAPPLSSSSPSSSRLSPEAQEKLDLLRQATDLFESHSQIADATWARRLKVAAQRLQGVNQGQTSLRIGVIGSSTSGISDLVDAMLDEPMGRSVPLHELRTAALASATDDQVPATTDGGKAPLLIRYGPEIGVPAPENTVNVPLRWLQDADVEILEVTDPQLNPTTLDTLYECDALLFVVSTSRLTGLGIASSALSTTGRQGASTSLLDPTLTLLSHFADKPGTRLLLNRPRELSPTASLTEAAEAHDSLTSVLGIELLSVLTRQARSSGDVDALSPVSSGLAAEANENLRRALDESGATRGPEESARLWDAFSAGFASSAVARVRGWVERPPLVADEVKDRAGRERAKALALQSADVVLRHALGEAVAALGAAREETRRAQGVARVLEVEAEEGMSRLKDSILPGWQTGLIRVAGDQEGFDDGGGGEEVVSTEGEADKSLAKPSSLLERLRGLLPSKAVRARAGDRSTEAASVLADSQGQVEETLSRRLPWWKLGLRVDDVRAEVEAAVARSFAKDLETKLIFEAGNLPSVALASAERTSRALAELSVPLRPLSSFRTSDRSSSSQPSPFGSAILLNSIEASALKSGSTLRLTPHSLSRPISARREQLLRPGGALDALAARAQSTMLGSSALLGGVGIGSLVCGAMAHPALSPGFPPHLVEQFGLSPSNAAALTLLAAVAAAWRTQGRWGKAKGKFWRDWQRLAKGLEDDLERNLDDVLRRHVFARALAASSALRGAVEQRSAQLELLAREVEELQDEVERLKEGDEEGVGRKEEV